MLDPSYQRFFPRLLTSRYVITSPRSPAYNCIAFALGETDRWWWPAGVPPYYWPNGVPSEERLEHFIEIFAQRGYELCDSPDADSTYEKVAIFVGAHDRPTHAARQLANGWWTSKLGQGEDIQHETLDAIAGPLYGSVAAVLRRSWALL